MILYRDINDYFGMNSRTIRNIEKKGIRMRKLKKTFEELKTFRKQKNYLYQTYTKKIDEHILDIIWERFVEAQITRNDRNDFYRYLKKRREI